MTDYNTRFDDGGRENAELAYGFTKEDIANLIETINLTEQIFLNPLCAKSKQIYSLIEIWEDISVHLTESHVCDRVEEVVETLNEIMDKVSPDLTDLEHTRASLWEIARVFGVDN